MPQVRCSIRTRERRRTSAVLLGLFPGPGALLACLLLLAMPACVLADGPAQIGPFVFVHGLQGPRAAATASDLGCNTMFIDLPLDAPLQLAAVRALIEEGDDAHLSVIIGLRTKLEGQYPISPTNEDYQRAVREWLEAVIGGLRDTRGLVAWATDHHLELDIKYSDADFRTYLLRMHGSLEGINSFWGTGYVSLGQVTRKSARLLDEDRTYGVGRPSIDLAEYERCAFRDVMQLWAEEIRRLDPDRLLLTGRISLYRSLTAIPDVYDVVMPLMPPDILEPDELTHNVHCVQMARRGGRFGVLPWLRIPVPPSQLYSSDALTSWIIEAGLRGAVGVGLEDWSRMSVAAKVQETVGEQIGGALGQPGLFHEPPSPPAAVLHQPHAGGREFVGTPAYGYLEDFTVPDFAQLAYAYRRGTIFGGFDYLCLQDLAEVNLDEYSVIIAPMCLRLPEAEAAILSGYVQRGGALMADLGLGMYEANSWDPADSSLAGLLGIAESMSFEARAGNLRVGNPHSKFPSVRIGMETSGSFVSGRVETLGVPGAREGRFHGRATEMKGYAFQGPSCFVRLLAGALPLTTMSVRFDAQQRPFFLGLIANDAGAGITVFGPYPVWSYWPPQDYVHAAVHLDLIGRRASYRLLAGGLAAGDVELAGSDQAVYLFNRGERTSADVLAGKADHRVYLGAVTTSSADERDAFGRRTGVVRLWMELPEAGLAQAVVTPVRVRPLRGQAMARIICYSAGLISLQVGGNGSELKLPRSGPPQFTRGAPTKVRFTVDSGTYPIGPHSQHQLTWRDRGKPPQTLALTADHTGRLEFAVTLRSAEMSLRPAAVVDSGSE